MYLINVLLFQLSFLSGNSTPGAGPTLALWISGQTMFASTSKGCCRKLAHDDHAVHLEWTIVAGWKTKNFLHSTHNFATGWILAPKCQFTIVITTESSWVFPESASYTTNSSRIRCPSDRKTKAPPPRWVSTLLLDIWVCTWGRPRQCSQDLCRPFLQAWKFHYLHYIMWHKFLCARTVTIHHSMLSFHTRRFLSHAVLMPFSYELR